jgi:ubiquinone/menaquinone biosynthesis C-methylase UbiE
VVDHVSDLKRYFDEVFRVLKEDGIFVFDDAIPDSNYFKQRVSNALRNG